MDNKLLKQIGDLFGGAYEPNMGANNHRLWLNMYRGEYPYLEGDEMVSLNLATVIASELARLTTLEMETAVEDKELNEHYQKVIQEARTFTEYGLALGDIILKPYPVDDKIAVDLVTPDMFLPIGFDSFKRLTHVVFLDRIKKVLNDKDKTVRYYTRLEEHQLKSGNYNIRNFAYESDSVKTLGDLIPLQAVDEWTDLAEEAIITGLDYMLFGHFRNPQSNNLDTKSPLGISCFSKATSLIQDADEQYSRILWEFRGSELAIDADITVLEQSGRLPKHGERLFRNLGLEEGRGKDFYQVFSPTIRDSSLFNGLNQILRRIEYVCDLAYGTISDPNNVDKTAEEIRSSKQRSYSTVTDIQKALEHALINLVRAMRAWQYIPKKQTPAGEPPKISFSWDDSLVVDSLQEQQIMMAEVAAGLIRPEKYLEMRYGLTEKEMVEWLPNMNPDYQTDDGDE